MKCLKCNHKLPDDSEFCQYCGSKIEIATDDIEGNTSDISVTCEEEASDNFERIDVDNMSPEEALGVFFGAYAKQSGEAIDANAKSQPNHEDDADFGLIPEKPIYTLDTKLIDGETEFLSSLRTSAGEKISWKRQGSVSVEGVNGMIDIYNTYLPSGQPYKTIYINMYGAKKSTKAPLGFVFDNITTEKPTKRKKEKTNKTKYCSRCGSAIDCQTKICTGCGKKYFKIRLNKFSVTILIMSIVIVALSALSIFIFVSASVEIDTLNTRIVEQNTTIENLEKENTEYFLKSLKNSSELDFFRDYAVIKSDDGTRKYHKYGCDDLDTSSFWIYNTEAAEGKGYYACSKCCD